MLLAGMAARACATDVETILQTDPQFKQAPTFKKFPQRLKTLWLEALARPEIDLKRQAAETIARAHREGVPDLRDTAPQLISILDDSKMAPVVRLAAARALIALDAREAAESLMKHARHDGWEMAQLSEPVLAKWGYAPMRAVWLERLRNPRATARSLLLTIRATEITELAEAAQTVDRVIILAGGRRNPKFAWPRRERSAS